MKTSKLEASMLLAAIAFVSMFFLFKEAQENFLMQRRINKLKQTYNENLLENNKEAEYYRKTKIAINNFHIVRKMNSCDDIRQCMASEFKQAPGSLLLKIWPRLTLIFNTIIYVPLLLAPVMKCIKIIFA
ncbi:hypothetical protein ENBRE01_0433 [Enteropsectra breve]|nr:hypothetical protein ENBRE01_0433 [Enteropsectra breve]